MKPAPPHVKSVIFLWQVPSCHMSKNALSVQVLQWHLPLLLTTIFTGVCKTWAIPVHSMANQLQMEN